MPNHVTVNTGSTSGHINVSSQVEAHATASTGNQTQDIEATNNAAYHWAEVAEDYANQAGTYASAANTSATIAGEYYTSMRTSCTEELLQLTSDGLTTIAGATTDSLGTINSTGTSYINTMNTLLNSTTTSTTNASIWAEGTDEEVVALGGTHSSKGWVDYVLTNPPLATVRQTSTGATLEVTDINGTTTANLYNGSGAVNDILVNGTTVIQDTIAYIDLTGYQDKLYSGTNIKTINNNSLLGSGDIDVQPTLVSGTNIKTINNSSILGSGNLYTPYRNIGEVVASTIPLTDAGLHILDGSLINGSGIYSDFVDYIADLYDDTQTNVNATIIGTLTNNNCVVSGFSSSNYMKIPASLASTNNAEYVICITTSNDITGDQPFAQASNIVDMSIYNGDLSFYTWDDVHHTITTASANTKYWIKEAVNGTSKSYSYSTDGINYSTPITVTDSNVNVPTIFTLGAHNSQGTAFTGSIDLNECYININGVRIWDGTQKTGFINEGAWQTSVSTYGVCGKFVYDSVNNTVRLPKITGFIEGAKDLYTIGNLTEAGLPNHSHSITLSYGTTDGTMGVFDSSSAQTGTKTITSTNASNSNSIYGNSNTVQPQSIKVLYYIVIATNTKLPVQIDIDNVATDLNEKMDIDGTNAVASVKHFDGKAIKQVKSLFSTTTLGTLEVDISSALPDDGYSYMVGLQCYIGCGSDSDGNNRYCGLYNDQNLTDLITTFEIDLANKQLTFSATGIINSNRTIYAYLHSTSNVTFSACEVSMVWYRRIGNNE